MKKIKPIIVVVVLIISFLGSKAQNEIKEFDSPELSGSYLGQKPPGSIPIKFAPGIVSLDNYFEHSAAVFSPDQSEVYWSGKPNGARYFEINVMKQIDGKWTERQIAFPHSSKNFGYTVFSSDGKMLFFNINADICYVEREGDSWTDVVKISPLINSRNSANSERIMSVTDNSSLYFMRWNPNESVFGKKGVIYVSRKTNGKYAEPEKLGGNINSDDTEERAIYVAPDESYLILESADNRSTDLFICYKMKDASWSKRINLNLGWARFPSISADGKYLFFLKRDGIYWVNTAFIEKLRPKNI